MTSPGALLQGTDEPVEDQRRSRASVLVVAGAALAGLALGGVLLLGGSPDEPVDPLPAATVAAPAATPAPDAPPTAAPAPPAPTDDAAGARPVRDPFAPLDGTPTAVAAPAVPGGPGGAATAVPVAAPVTTVPGTPGRAPSTDLPDAVTAGPRLSLLRVGGTPQARTAVLSVDGVPVTAGVGDAVGEGSGLLLLSVQEGPEQGQWTAVVQLGTGEPFDVASGASVVAR